MAKVVPPTERECQRCGRHDVWDEEAGTWRIAEIDGERRTGNPYCIHEWDINGTHQPIADEA